MTGLASPQVLHPGWYREIAAPGVDPELPGLYEWRIDGVGIYVGQFTHASRPRREYGLNVGRLLAGRPYRKATPNNPRIGLARARIGDSGAVDHCIDSADGRCISDWRTICGGSS